MPPDLVVLGNLLVDDLVFADGGTRMAQPGGAVLYAALGASLWGVRVGVASCRGDDYPGAALDALAARGVDLAGVRSLGAPGLRTWLLYEGRRRQVVHRLDRPSHAAVSPAAESVPNDWRGARALHLAPMPLSVQRDLLSALSRDAGGRLSLDPYVLLRADTLADWRPVLAAADVLFLSEDELELAAADADPRPALSALTGGRLRQVVFKRGARGGLLYDAVQERWHEWPPRAGRAVDPTGAGDAFAGGLLAAWLLGEPTERALARAIVSASFAIEAWGAEGLLQATPASAAARLDTWFPR